MYVYEVLMPIRIQNIILFMHYFWYGCNKTEVRRINTAQAWAALGYTDVHVPLDQLLVSYHIQYMSGVISGHKGNIACIYIRSIYSLYIQPQR